MTAVRSFTWLGVAYLMLVQSRCAVVASTYLPNLLTSDLYLTSQSRSISCHSTLAPGSRVYTVYLQRTWSKLSAQGSNHCAITATTRSVPGLDPEPISDPPFSLRQEDPPYIYLNRHLNYSRQEVVYKLSLDCWISPPSSSNHLLHDVQLHVHNPDTLELPSCGGTSSTTSVNKERRLCFQDASSLSAEVSEGMTSVPIASTGDLQLFHSCKDRLTRSYTISHNDNPRRQSVFSPSFRKTNYADHVTINDVTGEITVVKPYDREQKQTLGYLILCHVYDRHSDPDTVIYSASSRFVLTIKDIDDNPPVIITEGRGSMQLREMTWNLDRFKKGEKGQSLSVKDEDQPLSNIFNVEIHNDIGNFFVLSPLKIYFKKYYMTTMSLRDEFARVPNGYMVDVIFEDLFLIGSNETKAIYRITMDTPYNGTLPTSPASQKPMQADTPFITVDVLADAARFSMLTQISSSGCDGNDCFFEMLRNHSTLFGITPQEGLLFIKDDNQLYKMSGRVLELDIARGSSLVRVLVNIKGDLHVHKPYNHCANMCSLKTNKTTCEDTCGPGARSGHCQWRTTSYKAMSHDYSTCSPSLVTCPNNVCDELETMFPSICPQDCITEKPSGPSSMNTADDHLPLGIKSCASPVWCSSANKCHCTPKMSIKSDSGIMNMPWMNTYRQSMSQQTPPTQPNTSDTTSGKYEGRVVELCDHSCRISLAAVLVGTTCMSIAIAAVCCLWRRKSRMQKMKHASSVLSLSGPPSDYSHNDRGMFNISNVDWSAKLIYNSLDPDPKWEVPRDHIKLQGRLGEGEFGKVMKARAKGIEGNEGWTTVAVKMLKDVASNSELRDLLSEFTLLKDVSHKNVIKLLGACTRDGPVYVVVEYCEHGSLRDYLRKSRHQVKHPSRPTFPVENQTKDDGETTVVTNKDLLSFCWQIANGMDYLCQMKFVHRDLAARNVLVASSAVIKISDFGLTRDIYEEDAYMKTSKGRIPVKWLAPEALFDQVYTTKSDVWSFGVVLWEIVTLGMTPYPGIPHERLYPMLQSGYRMEKPLNCSQELYKVMQLCWQTTPLQRPNFKEIIVMFEKLLNEKVDYLDLESQSSYSGSLGQSSRTRFPHDLDGLWGETSSQPTIYAGKTGVSEVQWKIPKERQTEGNELHYLERASSAETESESETDRFIPEQRARCSNSLEDNDVQS